MLPVVEMRYAYFGQSGWRSEASRDKAVLFDSDRLAERFRLFRSLALASLADQSDGNFHFALLTSEDLPPDHLTLLRETVGDTLGDRGSVHARGPGMAGRIFREIRQEVMANRADSHVLEVVLDDGDALAKDFLADLGQSARLARARPTPNRDYMFFSHSRGISMVIEQDGSLNFYLRESPYNNQGLALLAPVASKRNIYLVSHKRLAWNHPSVVVNDMQLHYLRTIHAGNDSAGRYNRSKPLKPLHRRQMRDRFPLLQSFLAEQKARRQG
ncbi:Putative rhamnosyl transferase [Pseudooceanicola antarcticus]|uniref:Putative rhamnosyl transferase n=1 Tax=Pseudooceanicola antarcticus TaxID=1247613 RepID=A0A285J7P0_9RHOB|nr:glycosyltransferase [Pseudooceanicola antarcticus]PJE26996.1 hypothetical protein CVM39_16860 [Pseudooceanicola antarcticus]SNY56073.1 Putative rhamnosyl transferase [Pseudooceanicola antarcticus]